MQCETGGTYFIDYKHFMKVHVNYLGLEAVEKFEAGWRLTDSVGRNPI